MAKDLELTLLLLLSAALKSNSTSPPGKPILFECRSPEKETFTCRWEPGSDGGLPTTHRLYYQQEKLNGTHECPDYQMAGKNTCFFDKNHTRIWVEYSLTVVASNALGNATSDRLKIDVMEIVKPYPPENVTLLLKEREDSPYLHVMWEHPPNMDTKSGWITIEYDLRVKEEGSSKWKEYMAGTQTYFSLYSVTHGVMYGVQVRCRLDHGHWGEWSNSTYLSIPNYLQKGRPFWMLVSTLSTVPFLAAMCVLVINRKKLKQRLLPPVPGPKIRGVDVKLLKSGQSEDFVNALITNQNFPLMGTWKDQMEDYVIVTENDNGLLLDPINSQKKRKSLIIPAGFCLDSKIQRKASNDEKDSDKQLEMNSKSLLGESLSNMESSHLPNQKQPISNMNLVITEASDHCPSNHGNGAKPFENSSYVDIQRHVESMQEAAVEQEDYSRVKEVGSGNVVFLQKQNVSVDATLREKGNFTDCTLQKPRNHHETGPQKVEGCTELINDGYVDTVLAPPLI